jgi:glutathione peroxidase
MLKILTIVLIAFTSNAKSIQSIYDIQVHDISGKPVPMSRYKGKVLLIVNTASKCGFTPQLKDLESLYKKYQSQGLEVLAFPSNDFKQDPAENSEIATFAQKNYNVTFPFFEKGSVTGDLKQPLYQALTNQKSGAIFKEVHWNFEKFLVGRDGKVIERWSSVTKPSSQDIVKKVEIALASKEGQAAK